MTLNDYIREIPKELRRAIGGFDNDIRLGVFLALMKHGELSFSELSEKLGMRKDKAKLIFHLGKLTESALVKHYYRHQLGNERYSFYSHTKLGENLWKNIVDSLRPPPPVMNMEESSGKYITKALKGTPDSVLHTFSDNPSLAITDPTKKHKRKMPKVFSDQVIYEKAVIHAGT